MKKILIILFLTIGYFGFSQQSGTFKNVQITGKVVDSNGDTIFAHFSGTGNYLMNVRNPVNVLDAVNLQTLNSNLGLVKITEGGNTGYAIYDRVAANYGDTGVHATDLSYSDGASATRGATGSYSFANGQNTTASGTYSFATGYSATASGSSSNASGYITTASGVYSNSNGWYTYASGGASNSNGSYTTASGNYSFSGGLGSDGFNSPEASGRASFNHQEVESGQGIKESLGANSAILAGKNNETTVTAINSVALGGEGQSITEPNTVGVPHLQCDSTFRLGTDFKIIIFHDTMCGVKISTTDTSRIVPTR